MKNKSAAVSEKEREQKLKNLRRDLEEKLEDQLPEEIIEPKIRVEIEKIDFNEKLEPSRIKSIVEALLFASSKPMTIPELKKVLRSVTNKEIQDAISLMRQEYQETGRSFEVLEIAGGFEIATRKEYAPWICRADMQKKAKQATQSALETLAILAYKQPLTRAEIEELRGVDVSGVVSNLMERGFIKIVGKKEIPGRPFLYATTEKFLEHFGLNTLKDLPNIEEIRQLVEKSVKKEELLGTQNMVETAPEETALPAAENAAPSEDAAEGAEIRTEEAIASQKSIEAEDSEELDAEIEKALMAEEDFEEELIVENESVQSEGEDERTEDR